MSFSFIVTYLWQTWSLANHKTSYHFFFFLTLFLITFCRLQSSICFQISTIEQHLSSAPHSPLSTRPLLTSTLLELDKPPLPFPAQSPFPNDTISHGHCCSLSNVSSVSQISLSSSSINSSVLTSKVKDGPTVALALSVKAEVLALYWFLVSFFD